jgi:molecular chaperone DnaK
MKPSEKDKMIVMCENAKINISDFSDTEDNYPVSINNYGVYGSKTIPLEKDQFNQIVEPIIQREILPTIEEALGKANMSRASIDAVIVVGGSSSIPSYEFAVMNLFKNSKIIFPENRQWATAEGAALMQIIGGNVKLSETLGVLLSDDTVFPIFDGGRSAAGDRKGPISFSLTEDAQDAHFIFTDGSGKKTYATLSVPTKGFFKEKLEMYAELRDEQVAKIEIVNRAMGEKFLKSEISKLTFFYDIKPLESISYRWKA